MSGRIVASGCCALIIVAGLALLVQAARVEAGPTASPRPAPRQGGSARPHAPRKPVVRAAPAANDLPDAVPPGQAEPASEAPLPAQASELPPEAPGAGDGQSDFPTGQPSLQQPGSVDVQGQQVVPSAPPSKPVATHAAPPPVAPSAPAGAPTGAGAPPAPAGGAGSGGQPSSAPPASPPASPRAAAVELPPEPATPAPASSAPMEAAHAHVLPPDPSEVAQAASHGAGSVGTSSFLTVVLLGLCAACGAGVILLRARVAELDQCYSRLKEMLARLDDSHEALQKRLPAGGALAAAPVARPSPSAGGGAEAPDVSAAVERAVSAALADQRARLEQVDKRSERLARDLSDALAPSLDEVKRKLDVLERRVADGARNPFSAGGRSTPEPAASVADPTSALAAGLARAATRLGPKASGGGGGDPVALKMAEAIGGLDAGLANVERSASATGGPLERDVADLAGRLRDFVRGVKSRAGLSDGGGAAPMSLDEFVNTYADRIPEEARKRPTALLDLYFDTVSRGGKAGAAGPALSEQDALAQVFTYVDTLHGLRAKAADWDARSGGGETVSLALDQLFEEFRGFLRAYSISIVAPEPGQVPDASVCRVSQSVPRPNAQSNTVVRVIGCGFKHTMTGQVLRMAEVITAS